jgi:acyl-CoA hydrolase
MDKIDTPKRHSFPQGNKFGGRPKGRLNKDRLVRESISDEEFKLLLKTLSSKALGKKSGQNIDLAAAKMVIELLPVNKTFITQDSLNKIDSEEKVNKAMEETLTHVGKEELAIEEALTVTTLITRRGEVILTNQSKQMNEIMENEKLNAIQMNETMETEKLKAILELKKDITEQ